MSYSLISGEATEGRWEKNSVGFSFEVTFLSRNGTVETQGEEETEIRITEPNITTSNTSYLYYSCRGISKQLSLKACVSPSDKPNEGCLAPSPGFKARSLTGL